jgi:hypothetical protein
VRLTSTVTTVEWVVATEVVAEVIAETAVVAKVITETVACQADHSDGVASPVRVLFKRQMVTAALQVILGHRPELFGIRLWTNLRLEAGGRVVFGRRTGLCPSSDSPDTGAEMESIVPTTPFHRE